MHETIEKEAGLERLLSLAADNTRSARDTLSQAIVDLFLKDDGRLSDRQRALMNDVLGKLISSVEIEVRQYAVEALLGREEPLSEVQALLADDKIALAAPILEKSSVLRDESLINIVMRRAEEHRMAIVLRTDLSVAAMPAPADVGPDIFELLIRSTDAMVSRRAMEVLVAESKRQDRFQEPLLSRADLPAELATRMFWWVAAALRSHILAHFAVDRYTIDRLLERAARQGIDSHTALDQLETRTIKLAKRMDELGDLTDDFIRICLSQSKMTMFVASLAVRGEISFLTAWAIVADRRGQSLAVLLRALDMKRETAAAILLVAERLHEVPPQRPPGKLGELLSVFDMVPDERARSVLQFWQLDAGYRGAIEELKAATE